MENYIEKNLLAGEKIVYRSHRHWIVFNWAILWAFVALMLVTKFDVIEALVFLPIILAIISLILSWIDYSMSEIGVTNMRVVIKIGLIARSALETGLENIASVSIQQSVMGRILNYGTVTICDNGSICSSFQYIRRPVEFRQAINNQIQLRREA